MSSTSKTSKTSETSNLASVAQPQVTPGHRSVLIANKAFDDLREIQIKTVDPRLDLKDLVTAAVQMAQGIPDFDDLVVVRARELLKSRL